MEKDMAELRANRVGANPVWVVPATHGSTVPAVAGILEKSQAEVRREVLDAYRALVYRSSYRPAVSSGENQTVSAPTVTVTVPLSLVRPANSPVQLAKLLSTLPTTAKEANAAPSKSEGQRVYLQARALRV